MTSIPFLSPPRGAPLKIGRLSISPPVLQAPMAGFTNLAFRQMVRDYGGAGLQFTEMISARGFRVARQAGRASGSPVGCGGGTPTIGRADLG